MVKRIIQSKIFFYILIVIGAIVVFLGTYGHHILNPSYLDVCNLRGDWTQHYYGWIGYRNSDWQFPLGLYNNNTYPDSTSIIFTDSIPILAILFKIFRAVLPVDFQYFGWFTLLCYIAQAIIASRIFFRFTRDRIYSFVGSMLLLFSTVLLNRTFVHEALSAHFLILLMIETLLISKEIKRSILYLRVAICAILAAGIHIYFVLICGIVLVGVVLYLMLYKKWIDAAVSLVGYIGVAALVVWIEGGFSSGINTSEATRFDLFSININTLYNPLGRSSILGDLPMYAWGEGDSTSYLGLGVISLLLVTLVLIIIFNKKFVELFKRNIKLFIAGIISILIGIAFALLPNVAINDTLLFSINLPSFVEKVMGSFRCHGRTMWVCVYFIMIIAPIVLYKCINKIVSIMIIAATLILQVVDLSTYLAYKYDFVNHQDKIITEFDQEPKIMDFAKDESIKNVVLYKNTFTEMQDLDASTDVYVWAIKNGKTTNYVYLARDDKEKYEGRTREALDNPKSENLYILSNQDEELCKRYGLYYETYGRFIFARSIPL